MTGTRPRFIADENVGKLARLLRLVGYDTLFFNGENDTQLVSMALAGDRIILTRDTRIPLRRPIASGQIRAVLLREDRPLYQMRQVMKDLDLAGDLQPFSLCIECNHPLQPLRKEDARARVPPYVWQTQKEYMECPLCRRVYWKGTHWEAMNRTLSGI
ncbi:MAG: Mut7-C RNAse domain-containing protein [Dehalococcoidales bacterium]|nr:Mut7-C RNAse domain-containing protein [Dehalococcoidales bacterium]